MEPDNEVIKKKLAWAKVCIFCEPCDRRVDHWLNTQIFLSSLQEQCSNGEPTVPSTLGEELTYNPFMRVKYVVVCKIKPLFGSRSNLQGRYLYFHDREKSVQDHVKQTDSVETMRSLRKEKDGFKVPKE